MTHPRQIPVVDTSIAAGDRVAIHGGDGLFGRVSWVGPDFLGVRTDDGQFMRLRRHAVHYQPDEEDLAQRIEQVRQSWSERDREQRNNYKNPPAELIECEVIIRE